MLIAMLVMASVITVSFATSILVLNEAAQSRQLDKAIIAYYSAESGLEKSMFQLRKKEISALEINGASENLSNNSNYSLIAQGSEDIIYASISEDGSYQLDLYDSASFSALENPIKAVRLSWEGAGSWIEARWTPWTTSGVLGDTETAYLSQVSSPAIVQLYDSNAYLYRLRLIARKADTSNLQITAYSDVDPVANCEPLSSCQVSIPGRYSIKAVGEYPTNSAQGSKQAIQASMPAKSPLSGLYDYVIFSEEDIKKEN